MKLIKKLFSFFWDRSLLIFLIIGGANTVVSMAINFLLNNFAQWPFFFSSLVAFALTSVPSFYFNRKYSFQSKAPLGQSIFRFTALVTACFLLSFFLTELALPWMREHWLAGLHNMLYSFIRIVGLQVVFTTLNYVGQRLWAFKANDSGEDAKPA